MPLKITLFLFSALAYFAGSCAAASDPPNITIYYSARSSFQTSMAEAISQQLDELPAKTSAALITDSEFSKVRPETLVITIGNRSQIDSVIDTLENSVIHINDSRSQTYENIQNDNYTNIEITQPPCRYLALIKAVNKKWERVGYLSTSKQDDRLRQLELCAGKLDLRIISGSVSDDTSVSDATDRILRDSDVLLALADNKIYNRRSVKNILLTAYRHRIPVIGFSDNFVKAGALAGVYSTPEQLARQAVEIIRLHLEKNLSEVRISIPPAHYSVSVNNQVAKALDLIIPDQAALEKLMHEMDAAQ